MAKDVNELTTVEFKNLLGLTDEAIQADIEKDKKALDKAKDEEKKKVRRSSLKAEYKAIKDAATLHRLYFINDNGRIDKTLLIRWIDENFQLFVDDFCVINQCQRVWSGKYWKVRTKKEVFSYFQKYFKKYGIDLLADHRNEIYSFIETMDFKQREVNPDWDKEIAIAIPSGTLYIRDSGKDIEFEPNWFRKDGLVYILEVDFNKDLFVTDWQNTFIGKYFNDYYTYEGIEAVQKYLGSCLVPSIYIKKQLCLIGNGNNGKGVLCRVYQSLFDNKAISGVTPKKWGEKHHNISMLTAILNISTEFDGYLLGTDIFKQITGRDILTWDPKFQDTVEAPCICNHIFQLNNSPKIPIDEAILSRFLLVAVKDGVSGQDVSPIFEQRFKENRQALLAFVFQGLIAFIKSGYKLPESDPDLVQEFIQTNEPTITKFIDECLIFDEKNRVFTTHLYKCYIAWFNSIDWGRRKVTELTEPAFNRKIAAILSSRGLKNKAIRIKGFTNPAKGYVGVGFSNDLTIRFEGKPKM